MGDSSIYPKRTHNQPAQVLSVTSGATLLVIGQVLSNDSGRYDVMTESLWRHQTEPDRTRKLSAISTNYYCHFSRYRWTPTLIWVYREELFFEYFRHTRKPKHKQTFYAG